MSLNVERGKQGFQTKAKAAPSANSLGASDVGSHDGGANASDDREALLAKGEAGIAQISAAEHSNNTDDVWDGIKQFAEAYSALAADARERKKAAQLARRRQRYATRKAAGTLPKPRVKETPTFEEDAYGDESEHRCACGDPGASPPCWHCTDCAECFE